MVQALSRLAAQDMLSAQAANVWWLLRGGCACANVWTEWGARASLMQETRILSIERAMAARLSQPASARSRCFGRRDCCGPACGCARSIRSLTALALAAWTMHAYALFSDPGAREPSNAGGAICSRRRRRRSALSRRVLGVSRRSSALNMYLFYGLGQWTPAGSSPERSPGSTPWCFSVWRAWRCSCGSRVLWRRAIGGRCSLRRQREDERVVERLGLMRAPAGTTITSPSRTVRVAVRLETRIAPWRT